MNNHTVKLGEVAVGGLIVCTPLAAMGYVFGFSTAFLVFVYLLWVYLFAKLALYLFTRRSYVAKTAAITLQGSILLSFLLPKRLRAELKKRQEFEQQSSNK